MWVICCNIVQVLVTEEEGEDGYWVAISILCYTVGRLLQSSRGRECWLIPGGVGDGWILHYFEGKSEGICWKIVCW